MRWPPPCPACGKPPWRENHLVRLQVRSGLDGTFCVCMHCSGIWKLVDDQWTAPTVGDAEAIETLGLRRYAFNFTVNRALGIVPE